MYVTTAYDGVFAIDARTGDRLWKHPPLSGHFAECCGAMNRGAAITDKFVLIGQLDGVLVAHVVALMIMTAALTGVSARAETSNDQTLQTRVASALGQARRFESLRRFSDASSLGVLQSAIYTMQSATDISALNVEKFTSQRRMIVQGWAEILKTIEQSYDPAFDPTSQNDVPTTCVIPPGGFPCGADPSVIGDLRVRDAYVTALQENALKLKRAFYYQRLHSMDESAMTILDTSLDLFRRVAPEGVGPDFVALDGILRRTGLSETRRTKIDALFYAHPDH
ncbi:MAG TPA: hypothetical protein VIG47_02535 [Gemmatimonadaceae bacterium]